MTPFEWFFLYVVGVILTAFILGCLDAEEMYACSVVWPVFWPLAAIAWVIKIAGNAGAAFREW